MTAARRPEGRHDAQVYNGYEKHVAHLFKLFGAGQENIIPPGDKPP